MDDMDTILFNLQKKKKIWPPTTRWPRRCSMPRAAKEFSSKLHHIKIQGNKVCVYFLIVMLLVEFCNCNVLFFALLFFEKKTPKKCQLYWHFFWCQMLCMFLLMLTFYLLNSAQILYVFFG